MAIQRDTPYGSFNFLVNFQTGDATSVRGGFQEVSGMNIEVTSADYRNGNSPLNHVVKINGVYKVGDVTFKRGLIGATDLYEWIKAIREGDRLVLRNVTREPAGRGARRTGHDLEALERASAALHDAVAERQDRHRRGHRGAGPVDRGPHHRVSAPSKPAAETAKEPSR